MSLKGFCEQIVHSLLYFLQKYFFVQIQISTFVFTKTKINMKKQLLSLFMLLCVSAISWGYNVTFQVDMTNVSGFTTANVNGQFNNWCGGCAAMTDDNSDNIWEITIDLPAGTYEYKFTADGWSQQESLTPGSSCTVTNFGYTN
ncbi:MAG: hypothetical protein FJX95_03535, partial [Bacteroidetes bacterium]|nr:hypothetical protein [Bacteroidota bacterium]